MKVHLKVHEDHEVHQQKSTPGCKYIYHMHVHMHVHMYSHAHVHMHIMHVHRNMSCLYKYIICLYICSCYFKGSGIVVFAPLNARVLKQLTSGDCTRPSTSRPPDKYRVQGHPWPRAQRVASRIMTFHLAKTTVAAALEIEPMYIYTCIQI